MDDETEYQFGPEGYEPLPEDEDEYRDEEDER